VAFGYRAISRTRKKEEIISRFSTASLWRLCFALFVRKLRPDGKPIRESTPLTSGFVWSRQKWRAGKKEFFFAEPLMPSAGTQSSRHV
jgi:hypothetical protein